MHQHFSAEQILPYPVPVVFNFFANPENLPRLMPRWQKARIEEAQFRPPPPTPENQQLRNLAAGDGTELTLSFRPVPFSPVRVKWMAKLHHFVWNQQFCDTQVSGPFFFWNHCHKVSATTDELGRACTLLRDEVEFQLPFDPVSRVGLPVARAQFRAMFAYRHRATERLLSVINYGS